MKSSRQSLWIIGLTVALVSLWTLLRPWLPHSELAENNFQANLIRLQAWALDPHPKAVVIGSSLTGRLLPRYFEGKQLGPVANLGLDGSGPEAGLRVVLQVGPLPELALIEGHRLAKNWGTNDALLMATLTDPSMRLAGILPGVRADMRPSSILYSLLKRHSPGKAAPPSGSSMAGPAEVPKDGWQTRQKDLLDQLRQRGVKICLYRLPVGREDLPDPQSPDFIADLAVQWGLPYLRVDGECQRRGISLEYTDGLHLTPASAKAVAEVLAEMAGDHHLTERP